MICSNPREGGRASFMAFFLPPTLHGATPMQSASLGGAISWPTPMLRTWARALQGGWLAGYRDSLPVEVVTSVDCSFHAQLWNVRPRTAIAAWLGPNALWPWCDHSCRENPRRNGVTLRQTRDVPPPCCARLSLGFLLLAG